MSNQQTALLIATDGRVVEDMPFDEYAAIDALNGSSIVNMRRSPMFYHWMKNNPPAPTPALIGGIYTHRLVLEPAKVSNFAIWTKDQGRRFGNAWDKFKADHAGQDIITEAECEQIVGTAVAARKHVPIRKYADAPGPTELSLFWTDPVTGRAMKCRLDKWIPKSRTVADLKTTRSCIPGVFGKQAFTLGYHIKMAIQLSGVRACMGVDPKLKLLAIESKAPHESAVFRLTSDILLLGLEEAETLVRRITECERLNSWPAELEEETDLMLPTWATPNDDSSEAFAIEGLDLE